MAYLPVLATHYLPSPAFAAAIGQCLLFRRSAYERIGGHAGVRDDILEDVALARRVKAAGLRLRAADGAGLITCRMYSGWPQVRAGFAKNILAGYGNQPALLLLATLFHWSVFVFPWLWLLGQLARGHWDLIGWPLALVGLSVGIRALTAAATRQRVADAGLMPASVLLMTLIAAQSLAWHLSGGPRWKGRAARSAPSSLP
jgi:chlorobactene glucosyltransferase